MKKFTTSTIIAIIAASAIASTAPADSPYFGFSYCSGFDDTYLHLSDISFDVIPTSGKPCTLTANGYANQNVYVQYMHTKLKYGAITMFNEDQEVDTNFVKGVAMKHSQRVPSEVAPPGKYTGQMTAFDTTGKAVVCWQFWFIVRRA